MQNVLVNLPIPEPMRRGPVPSYPWVALEPGQAFKFKTGVQLHTARVHASTRARQLCRKFTVREMPDGIYCWRVDGIATGDANTAYVAPVVAGLNVPEEQG